MKKILITGPESSGKSTLAKKLAIHFNGGFVAEFAREYLKNKEIYTESDLLQIAKGQYDLEKNIGSKHVDFLFCDTGIEVIKIWSQEKYGSVDPEIEKLLKLANYDLVLLCEPNIPWEYDKLRENPLDRKRLFNVYSDFFLAEERTFNVINAPIESRFQQAENYVVKAFEWEDD